MCFGIKLPENFNFPYIAKSIGEFWRRWHITLSNWFRDYIFFPLERRRKGRSISWQHVSVMVVFIATGLWHGFSWNYLVWGGIHGLVIVMENALGNRLKSIPVIFRHAFTLLVLLISWVFFRAADLPNAMAYIRQLFAFGADIAPLPLSQFQPIEALAWTAFVAGLLFSFPWWEGVKPRLSRFEETWSEKVILVGVDVVLLVLFVWGVSVMFGSSFTSFLYAQF
jgi:alginate O-acetyltransferase complex protein AlgI